MPIKSPGYFNHFALAVFQIVALFVVSIGFSQSFEVKHYTNENGLPHNVLYQMHQDSDGYLWIGTDNGLACFDGRNFKAYTEKDGLTNPYVIDVDELPNGDKLMVTWGGGLHVLQGDSLFPVAQTDSIFHPITKKYESSWGNMSDLEIGGSKLVTWTRESFMVRSTTDFSQLLSFNNRELAKAESFLATKGNYKANHRFYISSKDYLFSYAQRKGVRIIKSKVEKPLDWYPNIFGEDTIFHISETSPDNFIIGGEGKIFTVDTRKNKINKYTRNLPKFSIWNISKLTDSTLVFITRYNNFSERRIYYYNLQNSKLINLTEKIESRSTVSSFAVDREQSIWICTDGDGLFKISIQSNMNKINSDVIGNNFIYSFEEGKNDEVWITTKDGIYLWNEGLISKISPFEKGTVYRDVIYDKNKNIAFFSSRAKRFYNKGRIEQFETDFPSEIVVNFYDAFTENDTTIFTQNNRIHQLYFDHEKKFWYSVKVLPFIEELRVRHILPLKKKGHFLISSQKGGLFFDTQHFTFYDTLDSKDGLPSDIVNHFTYDKRGRLWLATNEGLCLETAHGFRVFTEEDGLLSNHCRYLLADRSGNIWVGTPNGLSCFDGKDFLNFNQKNGLLSSDINTLFLDRKNTLWVGGSAGVTTIQLSDSFKLAKTTPLISLESVMVDGQKIDWNKSHELPYKGTARFDFSMLALSNNAELRAEIKLSGQPWQPLENHFIEFLSLQSGEYHIAVRAKRLQSGWSEPFHVSFSVLPPLWRQWWALAGYALVAFAIAWLYLKWRSSQLLRQNLLLEKTVAQRTHELSKERDKVVEQAEKLKVLDEAKSRFFANISHEFRTPLTLILGPVETIKEKFKNPELHKELSIVQANAERVLKLVNQLLDLAKLEDGKHTIHLVAGDFAEHVYTIFRSFEPLAISKKIIFHFHESLPEGLVFFDIEVVEQTLTNLLSNAFKFTSAQGEIAVTIRLKNENIKIEVRDTGVGIPAGKLPNIFDRFFQANDSRTREYGGTGIGLALVRELMELHKGKVTVESQEGKGATFNLYFPYQPVFDDEKRQSIGEPVKGDGKIHSFDPVKNPVVSSKNEKAIHFPKGTTVLVVEDNPELMDYTVSSLKPHATLLTAYNGLTGWQMAQEKLPNVIVSDVMMPKMDGFELLEKLKSDPLTSHIPVFMLTAKTSQESKLAGLHIGADDYLTKPFSLKELVLRVNNVLWARQRLRELFEKDITIGPAKLAPSPLDESWLENVYGIIESNLKDSGFGVNQLSKEIGMSASNLLRKIKALTNQSTTEFIRSIRLKKAKKLLETTAFTHEEIALQTGFSDAAHFSRTFKKQFDMNPSQYRS